MDLLEKNKFLKDEILELDKKENELKARIAQFKQMIMEKERKQKRIQDLLNEEAELLVKLGL